MLNRKKILIFCLTFLVFLTALPSAYAYFLLPYRWQDASFPYKVDSSASGLSSNISSAASSWNGRSPANLFSSSSYEVYIQQVNRTDVDWSGETVNTPSGGWYISSSMKLNWAKLQNYTSTQRQGVIAHEFGHVLALADDNGYLLYGDPKVLMIGYDSQRHSLGIYTPQSVRVYISGVGWVEGDVEGANYLY